MKGSKCLRVIRTPVTRLAVFTLSACFLNWYRALISMTAVFVAMERLLAKVKFSSTRQDPYVRDINRLQQLPGLQIVCSQVEN